MDAFDFNSDPFADAASSITGFDPNAPVSFDGSAPFFPTQDDSELAIHPVPAAPDNDDWANEELGLTDHSSNPWLQDLMDNNGNLLPQYQGQNMLSSVSVPSWQNLAALQSAPSTLDDATLPSTLTNPWLQDFVDDDGQYIGPKFPYTAPTACQMLLLLCSRSSSLLILKVKTTAATAMV